MEINSKDLNLINQGIQLIKILLKKYRLQKLLQVLKVGSRLIRLRNPLLGQLESIRI